MAEIFNIRHETDLSEYTSTVTDGGDLSQSAAAALASSNGGLSCLVDDTNAIYGQKDFTQLTNTEYRFRFYIDPNNMTVAGAFVICRLRDATTTRCYVSFTYDSGNYRIRAIVKKDDFAYSSTSYYNVTDAEHYVEVLVEYASGAAANDGTLTLWIDGSQQEQVTNLDIYDISKPDVAQLGPCSALDAGTSGTLYLDEFVLRDDDTQIGPVSPPVTGNPWAIYAQQ